MRRLAVVSAVVVALALAAPGAASADVIFDPADADDLAASLAEASESQGVCYGWSIDVDNEGIPEQSVGSNFGAGQSIQDGGGCAKSVEFQASISWTPESSESEDSAGYQVISVPSGPTTDDLDDLELVNEDSLVSDNVDADVYKAVAALPLLAADAGIADPIEASPAPESDAGDGQPTDSPGSDFWRQSGMQILWGSVILLAGGAFAWYAIRSSRRPYGRRTIGPPQEQIPEYVPPEWTAQREPEPAEAERTEDAPEPVAEAEPADESEADPAAEAEPADETKSDAEAEPADDSEEPSEKPVTPADKLDKPDPETRPEG